MTPLGKFRICGELLRQNMEEEEESTANCYLPPLFRSPLQSVAAALVWRRNPSKNQAFLLSWWGGSHPDFPNDFILTKTWADRKIRPYLVKKCGLGNHKSEILMWYNTVMYQQKLWRPKIHLKFLLFRKIFSKEPDFLNKYLYTILGGKMVLTCIHQGGRSLHVRYRILEHTQLK